MNSTTLNARFIFITVTILLAAVSRIFPHIPNFTPIAAMALFGGVYFRNRAMAFAIPLIAMLLSDLLIGFHNTLFYVYMAFATTTIIGMQLANNLKPQRLIIASLTSSVLFFIITNFGVWVAEGTLGSFASLISTYILGIPFFGKTLVGDLFYNTLLFGAFYLAQVRFPALAKA